MTHCHAHPVLRCCHTFPQFRREIQKPGIARPEFESKHVTATVSHGKAEILSSPGAPSNRCDQRQVIPKRDVRRSYSCVPLPLFAGRAAPRASFFLHTLCCQEASRKGVKLSRLLEVYSIVPCGRGSP